MTKFSIFCQNRGLTPLKNFHFQDFFKTSVFWFKNHSFLSKTSKNDLSWSNYQINTLEKIFHSLTVKCTNVIKVTSVIAFGHKCNKGHK